MSVNPNNYSHRGNNNLGVVVRCPNLVADRLVYFDHDSTTGAWVIRDFIGGMRLDSHNSTLTVPQIEADANHDEHPPWHNVLNTTEWQTYLSLRTTAAFHVRTVAPGPPNAASGTWAPL